MFGAKHAACSLIRSHDYKMKSMHIHVVMHNATVNEIETIHKLFVTLSLLLQEGVHQDILDAVTLGGSGNRIATVLFYVSTMFSRMVD